MNVFKLFFLEKDKKRDLKLTPSPLPCELLYDSVKELCLSAFAKNLKKVRKISVYLANDAVTLLNIVHFIYH